MSSITLPLVVPQVVSIKSSEEVPSPTMTCESSRSSMETQDGSTTPNQKNNNILNSEKSQSTIEKNKKKVITSENNKENSIENFNSKSDTTAVIAATNESQEIDIKTECDDSFAVPNRGDSTTAGCGDNIHATMPPAASKCGTKNGLNKTSKSVAAIPTNNNNGMFRKPLPISLHSLNPHIICNLCQGYLIDATTIVECLHSFCHSCITKHLQTEKYCPRCKMMINTAKPNIKPDTTLQAIVYKLVPGLYEKELMRKRTFYKDRPEDAALVTPEQRGEDTEHLIFSPSEYMSLSLEYADAEQHMNFGSDEAFPELLKPKYLQCPSIFTVAHLKKFVHAKFDISVAKFSIDIMYKVKTIVLLDHYTLMDVAYIYTWKRDAPMRFFFRVKESTRPTFVHEKKIVECPAADDINVEPKEEITSDNEETSINATHSVVNDRIDKETSINNEKRKEEEVEEVSQVEPKDEIIDAIETSYTISEKTFEIVPQLESNNHNSNLNAEQAKTDKLKITLVSKGPRDKHHTNSGGSGKNKTRFTDSRIKAIKDKKEKDNDVPKEDRKVENIKLKIDLSKQNSVTIINMSHPEQKEKYGKPEKEWKVKIKKDKERDNISPKTSPTANDREFLPASPLTVPPLTIKAERLSPPSKLNSRSPLASPLSQSPLPKSEEDQKSQFLKSFSLTPIKDLASSDSSLSESPEKPSSVNDETSKRTIPEIGGKSPPSISQPQQKQQQQQQPQQQQQHQHTLMGPPQLGLVPKISLLSKRKSKEPIKTIPKQPKFSFLPPQNPVDFKIKLPAKPFVTNTSTTTTTTTTGDNGLIKQQSDTLGSPVKSMSDNKLPILPSPTHGIMKPPNSLLKKLNKTSVKFAPPGSLTPHPTSHNSTGILPTPPGNRTPIAKRYQPILPKTARPNPFANIPTNVNKILKDAGTEIKSISSNESKNSKVYGPKAANISMGPPSTTTTSTTVPLCSSASNTTNTNSNTPNSTGSLSSSSARSASIMPPPPVTKANNNYMNLALYNATKSKGNEVPPGCRTPMYTPNSPIYSPNSPQYVPNYNIPTMPSYKYTPKPPTSSNSSTGFLQSILGSNSQMLNLFPGPPIKKPRIDQMPPQPYADSLQQKKDRLSPKLSHPFTKSSTSPVEDNPEKQLKVKSLLNSCNINIPSSLSITITREDSETPSNSASHPKHKSPVNNYIEILKLPEQTVDNAESQKLRLAQALPPTPPPPSQTVMQGKQMQPPQAKIESTSLSTSSSSSSSSTLPSSTSSGPMQSSSSSSQSQPPQTSNSKPNKPSSVPLASTINSKSKNSVTIHNITTNPLKSVPVSGGGGVASGPQLHNNKPIPSVNLTLPCESLKPLMTPLRPTKSSADCKTPKTTSSPTMMMMTSTPTTTSSTHGSTLSIKEKKTPSPDKKSSSTPNSAEKRQQSSPANSPNSTSPKSPGSAAKKFRPILPRSTNAPVVEVVPRKSGPLIGTYTSPAGVPVKIHKAAAQQNTKKNNGGTVAGMANAQKSPPVVSASKKSSPNGSSSESNKNSPTASATSTLGSKTVVTPSTPEAAQSNKSSEQSNANNGNCNNNNNSKINCKNNENNIHIGNKVKSTQLKVDKKSAGTTPPPSSPPLPPSQSSSQSPLATNNHSLLVPKPSPLHSGLASLPASLPPPPPPPSSHLISSLTPHLNSTTLTAAAAAAAAAANQEELRKYFNDTILRAQVQAAAANQFYPYSTAAQYGSAVYNYQQAYIMEQITRMRRAGDEAFAQYMQKFMNGENLMPTKLTSSSTSSCSSASSLSSLSSSVIAPLLDERKSPSNASSPTSTSPIDVTSCSPKMSPYSATPPLTSNSNANASSSPDSKFTMASSLTSGTSTSTSSSSSSTTTTTIASATAKTD